MDDSKESDQEDSMSAYLNPPRLFLMQSFTMEPDESNLKCTASSGKTPLPNLTNPQSTLAPPAQGHEPQDSPLSLDFAVTARTPMTADTDLNADMDSLDMALPLEDYCFITPSDCDSDEEENESNDDEQKQCADDNDESDEISDVEEYSDYDSDESSDLPMTMLLNMMSDAEEDTVFAENGYKKSESNSFYEFRCFDVLSIE